MFHIWKISRGTLINLNTQFSIRVTPFNLGKASLITSKQKHILYRSTYVIKLRIVNQKVVIVSLFLWIIFKKWRTPSKEQRIPCRWLFIIIILKTIYRTTPQAYNCNSKTIHVLNSLRTRLNKIILIIFLQVVS